MVEVKRGLLGNGTLSKASAFPAGSGGGPLLGEARFGVGEACPDRKIFTVALKVIPSEERRDVASFELRRESRSATGVKSADFGGQLSGMSERAGLETLTLRVCRKRKLEWNSNKNLNSWNDTFMDTS